MTGGPADPGGAGRAEPVIVADGVSRRYGDVVALTRVSFEVGPGVTGLLGPNGAGKTSLIRVLVGLHPASDGTVRVVGHDPRRDARARGAIGHVPEAGAVPPRVSGRRFVRALAVQHGLDGADAAAASAIARVGLDPDDPRPVSAYSKGMRQRVKVAAALVHDPVALVLDEPLNGLDPPARVAMIALLRELGAAGHCVLVSSHVLHEVARLASRVLVLVQGRLAAEGDYHAIRDLIDNEPRRIRVRTDRPAALAAVLVGDRLAERIAVDTDTVTVETSRPVAFRDAIAGTARAAGCRLWEVRPLDEDLDSVFTYLVARGSTGVRPGGVP